MSHFSLLAGLTALTLAGSVPGQFSGYVVSRVPAPAGTTQFLFVAMNRHGHVAYTARDSTTRKSKAMLWDGRRLSELGLPSHVDPRTLGSGLRAQSIDDVGNVYGVYELDRSVSVGWHPVKWTDGVATDLAVPRGGSVYGVAGASPSGRVCGSGYLFGHRMPGWKNQNGWSDEPAFVIGLDPVRAICWDAGGRLSVVPTTSDQSETLAADINDAGQIAAWRYEAGAPRAYLYDPRRGVLRLAELGAYSSAPHAINERGEVAGEVTRWAPQGTTTLKSPALWRSSGTAIDLGLPPGYVAGWARDLDDDACVIGTLWTGVAAGTANMDPFVWKDGEMRLLQDLIPPGSGWDLADARAIDGEGRIAGVGLLNGVESIFLLQPTRVR